MLFHLNIISNYQMYNKYVSLSHDSMERRKRLSKLKKKGLFILESNRGSRRVDVQFHFFHHKIALG